MFTFVYSIGITNNNMKYKITVNDEVVYDSNIPLWVWYTVMVFLGVTITRVYMFIFN